MTIGIDANEANIEKRVGSGQYAFEILRNMVAEDADDDFAIYLKYLPMRDFPPASENVKYHVFGPKPLWTQIALPLHLYFGKKPNVFFSPAHYAPRKCPVPSVITIHDLSYLKFPDLFLKKDLEQLKKWTAYSVKQAKHIIVPSKATKDDVVELYNYPPDRISIVPHGYDHERFRADIDPAKIAATTKLYGIPSKYFLYLGTLQPRKNIGKLLEAYHSLTDVDVPLVIAGKKGWMYDQIFEQVKELGLESRVIFTDYVQNEDVPLLYAGATLYLNPSLYEGFGMPLIEAQACGCLVAAANTSSLPEVVGPGLLFDPKDVTEIAGVMKQVLVMSVDERSQLRQKAIDFAQTFSWQKAAQQTINVLRTAAQK